MDEEATKSTNAYSTDPNRQFELNRLYLLKTLTNVRQESNFCNKFKRKQLNCFRKLILQEEPMDYEMSDGERNDQESRRLMPKNKTLCELNFLDVPYSGQPTGYRWWPNKSVVDKRINFYPGVIYF